MSYAARLIHRLAIVTPTAPDPDDLDDYGHAIEGEPEVSVVRGLVQPKTAREIALVSQAGAELSDHTIFLLHQRLSASAYIRDEPDNHRRFDITGIRSFEFGRSPHLEVDARLVGSTEGPAVPGS
jgi:hypothetical protein